MMRKYAIYTSITTCILLCACAGNVSMPSGTNAGAITGVLQQWHRVTLTFEGPTTREDADDNPFLNYRLDVTFRHGDSTVVVPGFYAADGDAANTGASGGSRWRVHFTPDETGEWHYTASFRQGRDVAVNDLPESGAPVAFDGASGTFRIAPTDKTGRDFRAQGMLHYVGKPYLQFAETGDYFIKGGADSPETFLAYHDFDGTRDHGGIPLPALDEGLHRYLPHVADWHPGDPTWMNGKGKGIIGALNYLAGKGMNSVYFLTMNVSGDGDDVWPWTAPDAPTRFDCSKLDQWERVFSHMDSLGIMLHVVTQETENDTLLDGGRLGNLRKLYYRELVARFGHHLGVTWNLGEENNNTTAQRKAFAVYIRNLDPYDHPIVVHNHVDLIEETYDPLLGDPFFTGTSFQLADFSTTHARTIQYLDASAAAGQPWVVTLDEIGPYTTGVATDAEDLMHDRIRKQALWANLMAGGGGVEWYFGWGNDGVASDLANEDWRNRDQMWNLTRFALAFFHTYLPFDAMHHNDALTANEGDYVFAKTGEVYAVYLPDGGTSNLALNDFPLAFRVQWYNPRTGGALQDGTVTRVNGGNGAVSIGLPPGGEDQDWVALITRID